MPKSRRTTLTSLVARAGRRRDSTWTSAATGSAPGPGCGELPGFGPWTIETIAMRALGDPDAFLPTDLGVRYAGTGARAARHPRRPDPARRGVAALARVRRPVPVGHRRPRHQPTTAEGLRQLRNHTVIDSPVGAADPGGRRRPPEPVSTWTSQRHRPDEATFGDARIRRRSRGGRGTAEDYFAGESHRLRPAPGPRRHPVPAAGVVRAAARSRTARPITYGELADADRSAHRLAGRRPGQRQATRSASSSPATAWSAPPATSPATAAAWSASGTCSTSNRAARTGRCSEPAPGPV